MYCTIKLGDGAFGAAYDYAIKHMDFLYKIHQTKGVPVVISMGGAFITIDNDEFSLTMIDKQTAMINDYFGIVEKQKQGVLKNGAEFIPATPEKRRALKEYYRDIQNGRVMSVVLLNPKYIPNGILPRHSVAISTPNHESPVISLAETGVLTLCSVTGDFFSNYRHLLNDGSV